MRQNSIFQHEAFNGRFFLTQPGKCDYLNLRSNYRHKQAVMSEDEVEYRHAHGRGHDYLGDDHAAQHAVEAVENEVEQEVEQAIEALQSLRSEALRRIENCAQIKPCSIEIGVLSDCIVLKGQVVDRNAKRAAEDIVASIPGVADVLNYIRVTPLTPMTLSSAAQGSVSDG